MRIRKFLWALLVIAGLSGLALGQETTGGIEGDVKDATGAVVPNATITVTAAKESGPTSTTGTGSGFRRTATTNEDGFFRLIQVPPGYYDVVASPTAGFAEARYTNVTVTIGKNTQI